MAPLFHFISFKMVTKQWCQRYLTLEGTVGFIQRPGLTF
jgi:hypothetical protein